MYEHVDYVKLVWLFLIQDEWENIGNGKTIHKISNEISLPFERGINQQVDGRTS